MNVDKFSREFFDLLTSEYAGINLTRINDYSDFHNKRIIDSLSPYNQSTVYKSYVDKAEFNVDIGFGGGFPILPMASQHPKKLFLGIET